ncbi:hypothetical protein CGZ98_06250 [Enemella evansiae]|uniref:hypothetical protein n=1 Tax=Enemella evansiae TaxID=2016499 RepID=UPI000B962F81|nr:hypothetical protein [Enemella evansiae]OYO13143.1 hypothetical protein CGZ98_06250 [Enemella evansiae]
MSDDRGKTYPPRLQRALDSGAYASRPPARPCAVPTYGEDGLTRCVAVDLDPDRGDVERDAQLITARVRAAGGHLVADTSPSGGQHLYLLLQAGVDVDEVLRVLQGWQADCPSLDPAPMQSAHAGLIAPPGAMHKSGRGIRQLLTPWPDVQALIEHPNPPRVWQQLLTAAPPRRRAPVAAAALVEAVDPITHAMAEKYVAIAQSGDASGYASPSEARQAVCWSAAAAGLSLTDIARRIHTGAWPGLAGLYARYAPHQRHHALTRDWRKATALVEKQRATRRGDQPDRQYNTRGLPTHPPARTTGYSGIRDWDNVLAHAERHQLASEPSKILLLRAMGQAAQRRGQPIVEDGVRALSLATHLDIGTVSRGLAELRDTAMPLIVRTHDARGYHADRYELTIPEQLHTLTRQRWRRGRLRALHPVFRVLGRTAGFVYEALARASTPIGALDLLDRVPYVAKSAVDDALATLAGHGLATARRAGRRTLWTLGDSCPDTVAELLGADLIHRALVRRYRAQRQAFYALVLDWIAQRALHRRTEPLDDPDPPPPSEPGELLVSILGAHCIQQPHP